MKNFRKLNFLGVGVLVFFANNCSQILLNQPSSASASSKTKDLPSDQSGTIQALKHLELDTISLIAATLPKSSGAGSVQIIGEHVYIFGGSNHASPWAWGSDHIQKAPLSDPTNFTDLGSLLPQQFGWAHSLVVDTEVFILGSAYSGTSIYKADLSNLASWSYVGGFPGGAVAHSYQMEVIENKLYLFGPSGAGQSVWSADLSNLSAWTDHGAVLPKSFAYYSYFRIEDNMYVVIPSGGNLETYHASTSSPLTWTLLGTTTGGGYPALDSGKTLIVGEWAYILGGHDLLEIYKAPLSEMTDWQDTGYTLPLNVWGKYHGVEIEDKFYIYGGLDVGYNGGYSIITIDISTED